MSYNKWNYTDSDPVNSTDPSGYCTLFGIDLWFLNPPSPAPCFSSPPPVINTPTPIPWPIGTPTPFPTPTCTPTPQYSGTPATTSGYYIPTESQARKRGGGINYPIPAHAGPGKDYLSQIVGKYNNNWVESPAQYANETFLFDHDYVCLQGSWQLDNGEFISCNSKVWWNGFLPAGNYTRENLVEFRWADMNMIHSLIPFHTIAVCGSSTITSGIVQLHGLEGDSVLAANGNSAAVFNITDTGEGLCPGTSQTGGNLIDIYTGIGPDAYKDVSHFFGLPVEVYKP